MSFLDNPFDRAHAPEKLLVVDDHPTVLRMISGALADSGLDLRAASTGAEALALARQWRPVLILLDMQLPDISGLDVLRHLRASHDTAGIAVIFLSGRGDREARLASLEGGAVDYINKPFDPRELRARVRTQLRIRRMEDSLSLHNAHLAYANQKILEAIGHGVIGLDRVGNVTLMNAAALQMLGYSALECMHIPVSRIIEDSPVHHGTEKPFYNVYGKGIDYINMEGEYIRRADGSVFVGWLRCVPMWERNEIIGAVVSFADMTAEIEQREAIARYERELQENRDRLAHIERLHTMGEMAGGFAHELNQPLTAILNFGSTCLKLLDKPAERDKLREYLEHICRQAIRASKIIENLRAFIKTPVSSRRLVDARDIVRDAVDFSGADLQRQRVPCTVRLPDSPLMVEVDAIQMQQVVVNFLRNSLDSLATRPAVDNAIQVLLDVTPDGATAILRVRDNGPGVPTAMRDQVFHPFRSSKPAGMGIGLAICETVVRANAGRIEFDSDAQRTEFRVLLPVHAPAVHAMQSGKIPLSSTGEPACR